MTWRAWQFVAPLNAALDGAARHPYLAGRGRRNARALSGRQGERGRSGWNERLERGIAGHRFRRLTLRSATGTAQRAIPTFRRGGAGRRSCVAGKEGRGFFVSCEQ